MRRIEQMNESGTKQMVKTWSRTSTIFPDMVGPHDRRPRRPQARARVRVRVDGRPQARRVRPHARVPRPRRRRQGEDAVTPPAGEAPEGGWESLKVAELQEELEARGLPKSGKKAELVARLEEDDAGRRRGRGARGAPAPRPPDGGRSEAARPRRRSPLAGAARPRPAAPSEAAPRRRAPDGEIVVRARARYVRSAPRKARLVMDHIRGKPVEQAQAILQSRAARGLRGHPEAAELGRGQRRVRTTSWARTSCGSAGASWTRARRSSATGRAPSGAPRASTSARAT